MKLNITKKQMLTGLEAVQSAVNGRSGTSILHNVFLCARDGRLEFTATDRSIAITCSVEASVKTSGATTVPIKRLIRILRELSLGEVDIETDDKNITSLRSGSSFFRIHGIEADEFPSLPKIGEERSITLSQSKIRSMLNKTSFAISKDESQQAMNGVLISLRDHKMRVVATDGARLVLIDEEVDVPPQCQGEFIVPSRAVHELNHRLSDKGTVDFIFSESLASLTLKDELGGSVVLLTRLIKDNYPDYRVVIHPEGKKRIDLPREKFLQALRRAEIMTGYEQHSARLEFTNNMLSITSHLPDVGEARETMPINYNGEDITIALNPSYFIEALNALSEEEVFIELRDEESPCVLKSEGFLCVVMPMSVRW
jgi:DNA polymerase-3 subunit beta